MLGSRVNPKSRGPPTLKSCPLADLPNRMQVIKELAGWNITAEEVCTPTPKPNPQNLKPPIFRTRNLMPLVPEALNPKSESPGHVP